MSVSAPVVPLAVIAYLERAGQSGARIVPLTPDASDRRYFRVLAVAGPPFVVAVHASAFAPGALPFLNVATLFGLMGIPIPRVLDEAADLGVLALEDLGDVTLQAHLGAVTAAERDRLYEEAVDLIVTMQRRGREVASSRFLPYGIAFDVDKLTWEMEFFTKHFLGAYRGVDLGVPALVPLRGELASIVVELASAPRVLCHRDFHSRNLMVHAGRQYVIDFQDARMGPDTYDLVSLLRDSYVDLPETLVDRLIARFAAGAGHQDLDALRRRFDVMALQRNLKALGTFGFQATSRDNPVYAQYVPRTLRYVRENLARHSRFSTLRETLVSLVPELSESPARASSPKPRA